MCVCDFFERKKKNQKKTKKKFSPSPPKSGQLDCDHVCQNAACAAERAELDELRGRVLEMEAQHEELRQQLLEFAEGLMQSEESDATASRVPQIESLEAWAKLLKPGMVVAIRAAAHERHLEGKFWLLLVDSEAFPVLMELVHASDQYEEGWCGCAWQVLHSGAAQPARLQALERVAANCCQHPDPRLPNVVFAGGSVGKAPRATRSGIHVLEEDWVNLLNESA